MMMSKEEVINLYFILMKEKRKPFLFFSFYKILKPLFGNLKSSFRYIKTFNT
jgi:hypothetical protein